ncbi:MAG: hypothetical protein HY243_02125 [Proteobacteria bacterium]|nr:hypothetical protein [Pseudomonadota bacterium]
MRDIALYIAGALAVFIAIVHGVLGETKVFATARIEPAATRRLLRLVWQAGAVAWLAGGILLLAAPSMGSPPARHWIIGAAILIYGTASAFNAFSSRGRHFGWLVLAGAAIFAVLGW